MLLFALMRLRFSPLLNFSMFGPWRYWQDGIEIADAGRVPHQTLQWGATYTPTVSKVILNSYQAGMSYLIGASPLPAMGALLWLVAVGLACGLWALGRELGLRYTAALLPLLVLVLVDNELHRDLDVYTAENTGRMAAVCALMLGVRALRRRSGWAEPRGLGRAVRGRCRQPRHPRVRADAGPRLLRGGAAARGRRAPGRGAARPCHRGRDRPGLGRQPGPVRR